MAILGVSQGGAAILGPSSAFRALPFRGYRERGDNNEHIWRESFADALFGSFDVAYLRFIIESARADMLDPTFTPSVDATAWLATAHEAPTGSVSPDTMLDMLAFIALATYPIDQNWSVVRRQAMIGIGWDILRRKGNRVYLGTFTAAATDSGAVYAVTSPPWGFALGVTDGEPSPGYKLAILPGGWCYPALTDPVNRRPWLFAAARNIAERRAFPAWCNLGIGFLQFRAGFSAVGEPIFPTSARLNLLANEHFNVWAAGIPTGWSVSSVTQNTTDASRNHEFALDPGTVVSSCAQTDLTAAAAGVSGFVYQSNLPVNNQVAHRFEVDYAYRQAAAPFVSKMWVQILDQTNSLYYNATARTWGAAVYQNAIPPSATSGARTRYGFSFSFPSATDSRFGTNTAEVTVGATSDGTASGQLVYVLYRVGLFEKWDFDDEEAAGGDRTGWMPLVDAYGRGIFGRAAVGSVGTAVESANGSRNEVKLLSSGTAALFPYHAAIEGRGYLCNSTWTNLLIDSGDFDPGWTAANCTIAVGATASPDVAAVVLASTVTPTAPNAVIQQTFVNPTIAAQQYVCGLYARKLSDDAAAVVDIEVMEGATSLMRRQFTLSVAAGWTLLPLPACTATAGGASLTMYVRFTGNAGAPVYGVFAAYAYNVTGAPGVLYPPIVYGSLSSTLRPAALYHIGAASSNVDHPLTRRQMVTLTEGALELTTVPTFDGTSQPDGYLFDVAQGAAQNRLSLRITSGGLQLRLIDNGGAAYAATIVLVDVDDPAVGESTWRRDEAIAIRARWDLGQGLFLSAGNGEANTLFGAVPVVSDASLSTIHVGVNYLGSADYYDGLITGLNVLQIGPPLP